MPASCGTSLDTPIPSGSFARKQTSEMEACLHSDMTADPTAGPMSELAYYYPEPYWLAHEGSWIKSLLLFFDGVAILLPSYMRGRELVADPSLAEPLMDRGLLKVLEPEWFVDDQLSSRLAEGMVELITAGAFDHSDSRPFAELSMSRMGFAELSTSRMGSRHRGVFEMIHEELKGRGLALDSQDGASIPLRSDVRIAYLMLLAQEARQAGHRHGYDLHPTTNGGGAEAAFRSFLELDPMPSRQDVVHFDLATVSIDLEAVPLDEVLDFRRRYADEHRSYLVNLRRFVEEVSAADPIHRTRLLDQRQQELSEQARSLTEVALAAFARPATVAGFALGLTGAAWTLATGDPIPAGLGALGALAPLLPDRETGSAYSYIFRAHRQWG
jgi:hypothetical protein